MSLSKTQADADLAAIAGVVARVKQSRIYRVSGDIAIMWGVLQLLQYGVSGLAPDKSWIVVDAVGVALTLFLLRRARVGGAGRAARILAAFALFYGFGFVWSVWLGHMHGREMAVFWRTLFLFGYSLAGIWFGAGFLVIGLGLTALALAAYVWAGAWFGLAISLVTGFGYILCGLWIRRA